VELLTTKPVKGRGEISVDFGWSSEPRAAVLTALDATAKFCGREKRGSAFRGHPRRCAEMKCVVPQEGPKAASAR
jgi:hypothetical protein